MCLDTVYYIFKKLKSKFLFQIKLKSSSYLIKLSIQYTFYCNKPYLTKYWRFFIALLVVSYTDVDKTANSNEKMGLSMAAYCVRFIKQTYFIHCCNIYCYIKYWWPKSSKPLWLQAHTEQNMEIYFRMYYVFSFSHYMRLLNGAESSENKMSALADEPNS